jgi:glycosyltransferase involved in cell wall biosynthesis
MKITIITVSYNSIGTISQTIDSVISQTHSEIEYIIVDGNSNDGTVELVQSYGNKISKFISEPDRGIYDAMNKGICLATGDVIGFLNADDFYKSNDIIGNVSKAFIEGKSDCVLGDVQIVDASDLNKINRLYRCPDSPVKLLKYGIMPPHPAFFVRRSFFEKYGLFKTDYKIAADFELIVRFLYKFKLSYFYSPKVFVTMRDGGTSNAGFKSKNTITKEILRACKENGLYTNKFLLNLRYFYKLKQMIFTNYK